MTPMPTPLIDTSGLVSTFFQDGSWIWALLGFIAFMAIPITAMSTFREWAEKERVTKTHKNHLIKRLSEDTWEYVGEYQPPPEADKPKHDDETPIYMTIGDDGELVEINDNGNS
jgi:hypothetical protein